MDEVLLAAFRAGEFVLDFAAEIYQWFRPSEDDDGSSETDEAR